MKKRLKDKVNLPTENDVLGIPPENAKVSEQKPFINKPCVSEKVCEHDKQKVLGKIRSEIEKVFCMSVVTNELRTPMEVKTEILQIIDKYKVESEG